MKKNIVIGILVGVIFMFIIKNNIDRRIDRLIQHIEFQKILNDLQPVIQKYSPKIYM